MNLYGFAGGDPVNFGDPMGLCPPKDNEPCNQQTGDPNLDDTKKRQNLEDAYYSSPDDAENPGYKDEAGGFCTADTCYAHSDNSMFSVDEGARPDGAILQYHTHPNAGKLDPLDPTKMFGDGPSSTGPHNDMSNARSPTRRGLNSYIITPNSIYRLTPRGNRTSVQCFQRWSNSTAGCQ